MGFLQTSKTLKRYPCENGKCNIEIVMQDFHRLFDERDPARFREKDLDDDAVEYIVGSAKEISTARLGRLDVFLNQNVTDELKILISSAIHSFFQYESDLMKRRINETLKLGAKSLFIGLIFLTLATIASSTLRSPDQNFWHLFFREGFVLLGWVSMWKPLQVFLYDWWPLADLLKIYEFLSHIPIEVKNTSQRKEI